MDIFIVKAVFSILGGLFVLPFSVYFVEPSYYSLLFAILFAIILFIIYSLILK